jgi:hypothetical protein
MRFRAAAIITCVLACTFSATLQAQTRREGERGQAPPGVGNIPPTVDIVEVVGCLQAGPNDTWVLGRASNPELQRRPNTNPEAVKAAAAKPLGTQQFRLMNIAVFGPAAHQGHKMAVRGILIKDPKLSRINTMSFQMLDAACAK